MNSPSGSWAPKFFLFFGIVCGLAIAAFGGWHWHYYGLPAHERPYHASHEFLRPSGRLGLILGIAGAGLMTLNLTYLVRKRLVSFKWLGSFRSWMAFHVFTGLIGPGLILLHSAYLPRSTLATISFFAMWIVVLAGIFGRYIYAHVPRSIEGHELGIEDVRTRLSETLQQVESLGVGEEILEAALDRPVDDTRPVGFLAGLDALINDHRRMRAEYRKLRRKVRWTKRLRAQRKVILPLARKLCRERLWYTRYHQLRHLMGAWRFFHRWLAIAMLLTVVFHVLIAMKFGNLWILRGD